MSIQFRKLQLGVTVHIRHICKNSTPYRTVCSYFMINHSSLTVACFHSFRARLELTLSSSSWNFDLAWAHCWNDRDWIGPERWWHETYLRQVIRLQRSLHTLGTALSLKFYPPLKCGLSPIGLLYYNSVY